MSNNADSPVEAVVVDLGSAVSGSGGAVWTLPHGGDLDANLIRLDADAVIAEHVNTEVDVLLFVHSGTGELTVGGAVESLGADRLALIPRGASRAIAAGPGGITYLSIHRRRDPMAIDRR